MNQRILIVGTASDQINGGVASSIRAMIAVYESGGCEVTTLITHRANSISGKFWPFLLLTLRIMIGDINSRSFNVVHVHMGGGLLSFLRKMFIVFLLRRHKSVHLHIHGIETMDLIKSRFGKWIFALSFKNVKAVCVLSEWWKNQLLEYKLALPIRVIPNSVLVPENKDRRKHFLITKEKLVVGALSRMVDGKGFRVLSQAIRNIDNDNIRFVLAGDGPLRNELELSLKKEIDKGTVEFTGWLDDVAKEIFYREIDIFCLPSTYDSFGLVFVEALSYGTPIIKANYDPVNIVVSDEASITVAHNDPQSVVDALEWLYENPDELGKMGESAYLSFRRNYSPEATYKLLIDLEQDSRCMTNL